MKKGQKFNSFYDKVVNYHNRKLLIIKNDAEMDSEGEYTKEYKALSKAKKDILDKIKNTLDGALTFTEIISYGSLTKRARQEWPRTQELSKDPNLEDYIFKDEKNEVKQELSNLAQDFVMEAFNEEIIARLVESVFIYEFSTKYLDGSQREKNAKFKNYKIAIAKKMLKASTDELKRYMPIQWKDFLIPKLDEAVAICDMINKSPQEIESKKIVDQFMTSKRYR